MSAAGVDVSDAVKGTSDYYKAVFDKNRTTKEQIVKIFDNVEMVDKRYSVKIDGQCTELSHCRDYILKLASIMGRSTNVDSPNFNENNIQNTMAPALVAIYTDRLCNATTDENGNRIYEYDFEKIREIMQGNADAVPVELYMALCSTFTDMGIDDKEKFIKSSCFEVERDVDDSSMDSIGIHSDIRWEPSSVLAAMASLYQDLIICADVPVDALKDQEHAIHKYIFNSALLNQVMEHADKLYSYTDNLSNNPVDGPNIKLEKYDDVGGRKWDYALTFWNPEARNASWSEFDKAKEDKVLILQAREDMDTLLDQFVSATAETFRIDAVCESVKIGFNAAKDIALCFVKMSKPIEIGIIAGEALVEEAIMLAEAKRRDKDVDQLINLLNDGNAYRALCVSASVSILPNSNNAYTINKAYIDTDSLTMGLRACALHPDGFAPSFTADNVQAAFDNDHVSINEYSNYSQWYEKNDGDWQTKSYIDALKNAYSGEKDITELSPAEMDVLEKTEKFKNTWAEMTGLYIFGD